MANITVDFLGSSSTWSNWRKKYFGREYLLLRKKSQFQTKDMVISSTLFCHFLPLSLKEQWCNCTLIICSTIAHLLQARRRPQMKNEKHTETQATATQIQTAIDCILLAAFSCKRKKRKQKSHMVYEAISETEALQKASKKKTPTAFDGGKKKNHLNGSKSGRNTFKEMQQMESRTASQVNLFLKYTMSFRI